MPLLAPRAVIEPFAQTWHRALTELATFTAVAQLLLLSVALGALETISRQGWLLGRTLEAGWLLVALRRSARGFSAFGLTGYGDLGAGLLWPLPRFVGTTFPVLIGAALLTDRGQRAVMLLSPWPWLLVGLAILLVPAGLVTAAVEGPGTRWLAPWWVGELYARLGAGELRPLRRLVAAYALAELAVGLFEPLHDGDMAMITHELEAELARLVALGLLAACVVVTGRLVRTHAGLLGHGDGSDALVLAFPDAVPRGTWTPPVDPVVAEQRAAKFAPIELEDPLAALKEAIERADGADALERYRRGDVPAIALSGDEHVKLAQLASSLGELEGAAAILEGLIMRAPRDAATPRAMVILARLCLERLGEPERGRALLQRVAAEFPESEAARYARERFRR